VFANLPPFLDHEVINHVTGIGLPDSLQAPPQAPPSVPRSLRGVLSGAFFARRVRVDCSRGDPTMGTQRASRRKEVFVSGYSPPDNAIHRWTVQCLHRKKTESLIFLFPNDPKPHEYNANKSQCY